MRLLTCILCLAAAQAWCASPPPWPIVREIEFEGNETTQPETMRRELVIHVGDPANPSLIESSRQAVMDLGLFRSVAARTLPLSDGVRLVFQVHEKWYVLPVPRVGNSMGRTYYGAALQWNNVGGLNQTLAAGARRGSGQSPGNAEGNNFNFSYAVPFVAASRYGLNFNVGHTQTANAGPPPYGESFDSAELDLTRNISRGPASQGWKIGGGILWQNEDTSGFQAPRPYGQATALVGMASYQELHRLQYTDSGKAANARVELAGTVLGSDYSYSRLLFSGIDCLDLPPVPNQSLYLSSHFGVRFAGPDRNPDFSLGGIRFLRGYSSSVAQGNLEYHIAAEYLRPLGFNWLRGLVVVEAGNVFAEPSNFNFQRIRTSVGLGLRVRLTWFVNVEVEGGIAWPTDRAGAPRLFAGNV